MTNFPSNVDDDISLPPVSDNQTEVSAELHNALRDAVLAIELNLGINANGTKNSVSDRLGVSINDDGTLRTSALIAAGLLAYPIRDAQVASDAAIQESKLSLNYSTTSLRNLIDIINNQIDIINAFRTTTGAKVEPHIAGTQFKHKLSAIDVDTGNLKRINIYAGGAPLDRDVSNSYNLLAQVSNDLLVHTQADGASNNTPPTANHAHNASGIGLNTTNFSFIDSSATDVQKFAEAIDSANLATVGTRIQTLFGNGIPRSSRSSSTTTPSSNVGRVVFPSTPAMTFLLHGTSSSPVESTTTGDDIVVLNPSTPNDTNNIANFSRVRAGDIATINYGTGLISSFIVKEKSYTAANGSPGSVPVFLIRINGKNLSETSSATIQINRSLSNSDKQGVLALAQSSLPGSMPGVYPSLIVGNPRGAEALSIGFNPDLLDATHYNLYLQLFVNGDPNSSSYSLPPVDVTGNLGATPGQYTLDSVVEATNKAFRQPGYNYRFIAFSHKGEFGIKLADSIGNASFSIISGIVDSTGAYSQGETQTAFSNMNNAINVFDGKDALGLGPQAANYASPPFNPSYSSAAAALVPTRIIAPLTRRTYYVNGAERERLFNDSTQFDGYGESYWDGYIASKNSSSGNRLEVTYQINQNLTKSGLKAGKTFNVQVPSGYPYDSGRFVISSVQFNNCNIDNCTTQITAYDAIHGTGSTPYASSGVGTPVRIYFSNDSVSFSPSNVAPGSVSSYKRSFEILVDSKGVTFSHERARFGLSGGGPLTALNLVSISPKLRGYSYQQGKKITFTVTSYNVNTGVFAGYLCKWDGATESNKGPVTTGKKGNVVRFYDETNIDYIDVAFSFSDAIPAISSATRLDIQLFSSLALDQTLMMLGTCQVNDSDKTISFLKDEREFGNTSEEQLSTSALDYIAAPTKMLHENGVIRGFDILSLPTTSSNVVTVSGGTAIVNGRVIQVNPQNIGIPIVVENPNAGTTTVSTISWFLCVNDRAELELVANTDFINGNSTYEGLGLDHSRLFYVSNPNVSNAAPYAVRGTYLSNLISHWKDVHPIALVIATVGSSGGTNAITSVTYSDFRRYTTNGSGGMTDALVLGPQSSFRSLDSVLAWANQLVNFKSSSTTPSPYGKTIVVKGNVNISSPFTLNFANKVNFKGDNGSFTSTVPTAFNIVRNTGFDNIKFVYNYDASADGNFSSSRLINSSTSLLKMTTTGIVTKNVSVTNCHFTCPYVSYFDFFNCTFAGATHRVENLKISDNFFENTSNSDDFSSVLSIVSSMTVAPSNVTGARLVSCVIENNLCNKSQMLALTATYNGTNVLDAIVPVNVKIRNNICGSINFCVKRDQASTTFDLNNSLQSDASISISGNTCRYIFIGSATGGLTISSSSDSTILSTVKYITPNTSIMDNMSSWIHVGVSVPTTSANVTDIPLLIIKNNKLSSRFANTLSNYAPFQNNWPALLVQKVTN